MLNIICHIFINIISRMFFISFLFYFSGNYKPQLLFFVQGNKITFVLQSKANEQGCEGGTAKPLPLSLAKLCSSCGGRKTTSDAEVVTFSSERRARRRRLQRSVGDAKKAQVLHCFLVYHLRFSSRGYKRRASTVLHRNDYFSVSARDSSERQQLLLFLSLSFYKSFLVLQ